FFEPHNMPGKRMNIYGGWDIYGRGIYDVCIDIRGNHGKIETFFYENGMGVANEERFLNEEGQIQDVYRIQFVKEHLAYVHQPIAVGSDMHGHQLGTFIDCGSRIRAYNNSYGIVLLEDETAQ
ncbi:family 1 glycosylhydrolase, partial [Listeria monocytogenes]|uniref:family 1 glycosylhydrolase n=1 Tax=Listeria monocytogenes TaxID=1639 RepID=UPI000A826A05